MRHHVKTFLLLACGVLQGLPAHAQSDAVKAGREPAAIRMNAPGPEGAALALRTGQWDVVETTWPAPGAQPQVIRGQIAERRMVGLYLQETIWGPDTAGVRQVARVDYLGFNRVTGRWDYLSMDTRVPVGLMPAWSVDHDPVDRIRVEFTPFALPGPDVLVTGQLVRMEQVIGQTGADADAKDQYFVLADGTGVKWLGHRYAYTRRAAR